MKIVSFGDVHMAISPMAKIAVELATADLVILSGDLTNFGGRTEVQAGPFSAGGYIVVQCSDGRIDAELKWM